MRKSITYTLLADGSSDEVLIHIINWTIGQHWPNLSVRPQFAGNLGKIGSNLSNRISAAMRAYPCDLLFVHRDAESVDHTVRYQEIISALDQIHSRCVPIIPIRMTEAWLLSDEIAIREAAGNRMGALNLHLPPQRRWEYLPDPKQILHDALTIASEKSGRALKKFNPRRQYARVAELTQDFSDLRNLDSFAHFEFELTRTLPNIQ
jgi:hypothetical protein